MSRCVCTLHIHQEPQRLPLQIIGNHVLLKHLFPPDNDAGLFLQAVYQHALSMDLALSMELALGRVIKLASDCLLSLGLLHV